MYHDTIHIKFGSTFSSEIRFSYSFFISTHSELIKNDSSNLIKYKDILDKFENIGFNVSFLNFPNIKDKNQKVYCSYNHLNNSNFDIFFKAYNKILKSQGFDIVFEYGTTINNVFFSNNMNFYSAIRFAQEKLGLPRYDSEKYTDVIKDIEYFKVYEEYRIIDKVGETIHQEYTDYLENFKHTFFDNKKVQVYLRKYKLRELMDET